MYDGPGAPTATANLLHEREISRRVPLLALAAAALASLALGATLYAGEASERSSPAPVAHGHAVSQLGLDRLPARLQGPVSQDLGADGGVYRVSASGEGFTASSPAQRLSLRFGRGGVSIRSGATRVGLSLRSVGYGGSLSAPGQAAPHARSNRVLYRRKNLSEWYLNGPVGLEQGFTITGAPSADVHGPLTLSLALSGNAHGSLAPGGQSISLSHPGGPSLRYSGLSAADARGRALHSWLELGPAGVLLRVDARGARYPLRIDPFVQQKEKLTGSGELGEGLFGSGVALSADGNTALVGAPDDAQSLETEGEVTEKSKIVKNLLTTTGVFGGSGVSGTKIPSRASVVKVINSKEVELSSEIEGTGAATVKEKLTFTSKVGSAYVLTRSGSSWTQQAKLANPLNEKFEREEVGTGRFGESVALSADGNTALIGAPEDGATTIENRTAIGAAWVYTRSGSTWTRQGAKLKGNGEKGNALFGASVALGAGSAGNTALIGGFGDNAEVGAAWVFTRSAGVWKEQKELKEPENAKKEREEVGKGRFGFSAALGGPEGPEGTTALIGAPEDNGAVGAAFVYRRNAKSEWLYQSEPKLTGTGELGTGLFGETATLASTEGNTALIGAPINQRIALETEAEVTEKSPIVKGLSATTSIVAGDEVSGAKIPSPTLVKRVLNATEIELTSAVEGTGSATVKEALTFKEKNGGAAWVFTRSSEKWTQQAKLTPSGEIGEGFFGEGITLTANGGIALIGAPGNNGNLGAAWAFTRSGTTWTQIEELTPTDESGKGQFGDRAALSSEGTTALLGGFADNFNVGAAWAFTTGPTPTVVTESASGVAQTSATLHATVNPNGSEVTDCRFEYGTATNYGLSAPCTTSPGSGTSPVAVSAIVTALLADTTYHFRISATDSGTSKGSDQTFATLPNPPTVETEGISNLTTNSATLHGSVNPNATGLPAPVIECKLEWGTTTAYGSSGPCSPYPGADETKAVRVTAQATGLSPHTVYHFRIFAKNAGGESAGSDFAFTTLGVPPTTLTAPASAITLTTATLNATVNPNGFEVTACNFEYGTTTSYGSSAPCAPSPGSGSSPVAVSASTTGLTPFTTYHFRVSASGAGGASMSTDRTFTTATPHYYSNLALVGSTPRTTIEWGTITLRAAKGGVAGSFVTCHTVGAGPISNPSGGFPGEGSTQAFATFACESEGVCPPGQSTALVGEGLPWHEILTEETLSTTRQETTNLTLRIECLVGEKVEGGSKFVVGSGEKGLRPAFAQGTEALHPPFLEFGEGSGELEAEGSGGTVTRKAEGAVKLLGYNAQELLSVKDP